MSLPVHLPSASFVSHAPTMTAPTAESGKPLYRRGLSFKDLWHVLKTRYPFSRLPWGATLGSSPGGDGGFPLPTSPQTVGNHSQGRLCKTATRLAESDLGTKKTTISIAPTVSAAPSGANSGNQTSLAPPWSRADDTTMVISDVATTFPPLTQNSGPSEASTECSKHRGASTQVPPVGKDPAIRGP